MKSRSGILALLRVHLHPHDEAAERAGSRCRVLKQLAFFGCVGREAREVLNDRLEKYVTDGALQLTLPDVLKLPRISQHRAQPPVLSTVKSRR